MKLVVGLGNPDMKYSKTYHNLGFMAIDRFAEKNNCLINKRMCDGLVGEFHNGREKIILLKPLTYMNLSGFAVRKVAIKFKIPVEDIFVFVDDIDLPLGIVRYRENGSAGTHNGLKSIVNELDSINFRRIKIGIGRDEKFADLADYVLSRIPDDRQEAISAEIDEAVRILEERIKS